MLILGLFAVSNAVTPVQKVIDLLKKLTTKLEEEGTQDAVQYEKFSCFCKNTADNKQYAVEKSTEKIEVLTATIAALDSDINDLNSQISELGVKITALGEEIATASTTRSEAHEVYVTNNKDVTDAISAIDRAIEAMKSSKAAMAGKVQREAIALVAHKALALGASSVGSQLQSLATQPGKAYESSYHSNDIIATLEGLKVTFRKSKNELDEAEFEAMSAFEKKKLALTNEQTFAEKEKAEKEKTVATKTEEMSIAEADKTQETKEMTMDQEFLTALTADCEKKATLWDQRSTTRAAELTTLAEATKTLETGVAENYGANKKLVDFQKGRVIKKANLLVDKTAKVQSAKSPSFLQLRGSRDSKQRAQAALVEKISNLLMAAANRTGSPVLAAAVMKVTAASADDHFVKVRGLIKDLISKLEADAQSEATQKSFCDEHMKIQVTARDDAKLNLEDFTAKIKGAESKLAELQAEIAALSKAIAENVKALNEATELRAEESAANSKTVTDAGAGKEAVESAITVLTEFYGESLLQKAEPTGSEPYVPYVAKDANREGKTIGDLAPKVFDDEYHGSSENKGIIGILQVIQSDFERTETTVAAQEEEAQAEFEEFKTEIEADSAAKQADIELKEGQITDLEEDLVGFKDSKKDAETSLELSEEELEKLKKMCVEGEETYAERVAKREEEIEALKQAMEILNNWQN